MAHTAAKPATDASDTGPNRAGASRWRAGQRQANGQAVGWDDRQHAQAPGPGSQHGQPGQRPAPQDQQAGCNLEAGHEDGQHWRRASGDHGVDDLAVGWDRGSGHQREQRVGRIGQRVEQVEQPTADEHQAEQGPTEPGAPQRGYEEQGGNCATNEQLHGSLLVRRRIPVARCYHGSRRSTARCGNRRRAIRSEG